MPLRQLELRPPLTGHMNNLSFRPAIPAERTALEDLQRRASLVREEYRDALLENPAELDGLFVEPKVWRRGIGRGLLEEAQAFASADGAMTLFVVANPRAQNFY